MDSISCHSGSISAAGVYDSVERLHESFNGLLKTYEAIYGRDESETFPSERLSGLIQRAYAQTGKKSCRLGWDEYDAPMLDALDKPETS